LDAFEFFLLLFVKELGIENRADFSAEFSPGNAVILIGLDAFSLPANEDNLHNLGDEFRQDDGGNFFRVDFNDIWRVKHSFRVEVFQLALHLLLFDALDHMRKPGYNVLFGGSCQVNFVGISQGLNCAMKFVE
jgi:hypothetical protein